MAINPDLIDIVKVTELPDLQLAISNFFAHCPANGVLGKVNMNGLAQFIAPYVSAIGSSPYVATTGSVLPNPTDKPTAITFISNGTFTQTTGSSIVTTQFLNLLSWNGTTWSLTIEIPINLSDYITLDDYLALEKKIVLIDEQGFLNTDLSIQDNGGSSARNDTDDVYEVTAPSASTGIIIKNIAVQNIEYYAEFEVRLASGTTGLNWILGWDAYGEGISFIPDGTWQTVMGSFIRTTSTTFPILIGLDSNPGSGVLQIRNFSVRQADAVTDTIADRIKVMQGRLSVPYFDLAKELETSDNVFIPVGEHIVNATIDIPSGKTIFGVRGKSILKAASGLAQVIQINNKTDITLRDFTIKGTAPDTVLGGGIPMPVGGTIDDLSDALSLNLIGSNVGIGMQGERVNISRMEICNFNGRGIYNVLSGKSFEYGIKITDCYFHDNYLCLQATSEAEYSSYIGNTFSRSQIGIFVESGNNLFVGCHFDKNRVGVMVGHGLNNSHGTFSACTFNHNAVFGLITDQVSLSEAFSGCQFWYGNVMLLTSKGINMINCTFGATIIYIDGSGGGQSQILGGCFSSASIQQNYNGNASNILLKNNFFLDGSSSASINN